MPPKRRQTSAAGSPASSRTRHVARKRVAGAEYLYYRRGGLYVPLRGPEGSAAFLEDYDRAHQVFEAAARSPKAKPPQLHTVQDAVTAYLASADYRGLAAKTREDYRRTLDAFRGEFGAHPLAAFGRGELQALRARHAPDPEAGNPGRAIGWNNLRSRMISVVEEYLRLNPELELRNHWREAKRLKPPKANSHRPWPPAVLKAVMTQATPEFRCLLVAYLMTAQRGGDVTRWEPWQYDRTARTLNMEQRKTAVPLLLRVPDHMARAIEAMAGRHPERLFVTPQGKPWTTLNAQETLRRLLAQLKLPRQTLHGLRATGPVALKMLGFENRVIRELTGHREDRTLEIYLQGVDGAELRFRAQDALAEHFGGILEDVLVDPAANARRVSGVTGRAARKAREAEAAGAEWEKSGKMGKTGR